jgi:hypothetical protein
MTKQTFAAIFLILLLSAGLFAQEANVINAPKALEGKSAPPPLFQFVFESDLVVVGSTNGRTSVGKRVKKPELDLGDYAAASVDDFRAEEVLFSKELFDSGLPLSDIIVNRFSIFRGLSPWNVFLKKNTRYLLFIKRLPVDNQAFVDLELDKDKPYFQLYKGTQTIFPERGNTIHGTFNYGIIDLSKGQHPQLVEEIRQFSKALSPGDNTQRLENLRELTLSDNEVLRTNAKYAISHFGASGNGEISELISMIEGRPLINKEELHRAVRRLGELKAVDAIPPLVKLLPFRVQPEGESRNDLFVIEYHTINNADRYPAMQALFEIGDESLPSLFDVLETEECGSLRSELAFETVKSIYLKENMSKAADALNTRAAKSQSIEGRVCLESASRRMRMILNKLEVFNR